MRAILAAFILVPTVTLTLTFAQELPSIGIVSPANGSTVVGPDVTVGTEVFDFTLVPPTGTEMNPGEGHLIYYLDVEPAFIPGQSAIPTDPGATYAASDQLTHTFQGIAPGSHFVAVLLVFDNHAPVIPPAIAKASFTVAAPSETAAPQPSPSATEVARSVNVQDETPSLTSTESPTPPPAVLPAQVPNGGGTPGDADATAESEGGPSAWLFVGAAAGVAAAIGGGAVALRVRRKR
jgi:hypothetical protein